MGDATAISWTDHTFNAWWGCTKIPGPGGAPSACDHCYAEAFAKRTGHAVWGQDAPRRMLSDNNWRGPLRWNARAAEAGRPALVFCSSMADVFEARDDLDESRSRLWELIEATPHLIWQLLTKRPEQIAYRVPSRWLAGWPENVWIGATVEDERAARLRIPRLARIPAPVRFLSCEPLLGDVSLWPFLEHVGWVIVGGESGPRYRPMPLRTAERIVADCQEAGVPVFFKQMADRRPGCEPPPELLVREFPAQARRSEGKT